MSATRSTAQHNESSLDVSEVSIADIKYPKLYEYLMTLNKPELKFIMMFVLNYNNPEYAVEEVRTSNQLPKSELAKLTTVLVVHRFNPSEKELIKVCDNILKLNKVGSKLLYGEELSLSEEEDDDEFETEAEFKDRYEDELNIMKSDELGYRLLCYNICPEVDLTLDGITDEERKQHSIINVIEKKIKFKHILKAIQKYIDGHLFGDTNEISVLGEVAKKFNLNFRIHVYNSEKHCEELLRPDNNGWLIKLKPNQTKFEIGKVDKHFFNYEYLSIPREYLNNVNKIYTYISLIGRCKRSDDSETCEPCCSNLELITALKKFKVVVYDKSIGKLVYKNAKISDNTGLNENTMNLILQTLHLNPDLMKYARKNEYKMIGSINK